MRIELRGIDSLLHSAIRKCASSGNYYRARCYLIAWSELLAARRSGCADALRNAVSDICGMFAGRQ